MEVSELSSVDGKSVHHFYRLQAYAGAMVRIIEDYAAVLPVADIVFDRIYYDDAMEASGLWRLPEHRREISLNWWKQRYRETRRIDVSFRCAGVLCGLMLAKRSRKRLCISVRFLEGNPHIHPLSGYVLPVALIVAESFADVYGIRQICISRPDKGMITRYLEQGYGFSHTDKTRIKRHQKPRAKLLIKTLR